MQAGKTELVCQYHGPDAVACRHRRFIEHAGRLALLDGSLLHVVGQYQHLGTAFSQSLSLKAELDGRIGKAAAAFRQLSKAVFNNRRLSAKVRLQLLESLVLSIVFYGSGTWPLLNQRQFTRLAHVIVKWQRQITMEGFWRDSRVSDAELQAQWKLPVLSAQLAKHRLLYAFQVAANAPEDLITCLSAEDDVLPGSTWCNALRHAIAWMRLQDPDGFAHEAVDSTEALFQWIHLHRHDGPPLVRRLAQRAVQQDCLMFELKKKTGQIVDACRLHGVVFDLVPEIPLTAARTEFPCHVCGQGFSSVQGLQAHQWRKHQIFSEERRYIFDTTCRACNRCFWTVQRLQQHLRWSRKYPHGCLATLKRYFQPLSAPVSCDIPAFAHGFSRLPACAVEGPLPDVMETVRQQQQAAQRSDLLQQWERCGFPAQLEPALKAAVFAHCSSTTLQWIHDTPLDELSCDQLMHWWLTSLEELSDSSDTVTHSLTWSFLLWGQTSLPEIIEQTEDPDYQICMDQAFHEVSKLFDMSDLLSKFDRLARAREPVDMELETPIVVPDSRQAATLEPFSLEYFEQPTLLRQLVPPVIDWPGAQAVPVVTGLADKPTLIILHMFSGRRRHMDCHYWIHALAKEMLPELNVVSLSMDTAIDGTLGNMMSGPSFNHAVHLAHARAFGLGLTGPPCETWTAARHLQCDELHGRGPRPLRSCLDAWGLAGLSLHELQQLSTGSHLMLHSMLLEILIGLGGGGSIMEHPSLPDNESYASIWRTSVHRALIMRAYLAQMIYVEQWRFGALSVKPTVLRGVGLPKLARHIHSCRVPNLKRPTAVLAGYDPVAKRFRTSAAKEYPPQFCEAIIRSAFWSLRLRIRSSGLHHVEWQSLDASARSWVQALADRSCSSFSDSFLPDYQPTV